MTNLKQKVKELIELEKIRLGTYQAVANKCGVSEAAITLVAQGKYPSEGETMMDKIADALGYMDDDADWKFIETLNSASIIKIAEAARKKSLFVAISEKAGAGKTVTLKNYYAQSRGNVFYVKCREWGKRDMLLQLLKNIGASVPRGYMSNEDLSQLVFDFFSKRSRHKPQLIIDEADKLKPAAMRFMIPLFNEHEDKLSVIIAGTENLEKEIKRGVNYAKKGYDEIDSRFGRNFIHLTGAPLADVRKICVVNGINNAETQKQIFEECGVVIKRIEDRDIKVVEDLRRLKRIVQRHQLKN